MEPDDEYNHWTYYVLGWSLHFYRWKILSLMNRLNGYGCNVRIVLYVPYAQCLEQSPILLLYRMQQRDTTLLYISYNKGATEQYSITSNDKFRDYYFSILPWAPIQFDGIIPG